MIPVNVRFFAVYRTFASGKHWYRTTDCPVNVYSVPLIWDTDTVMQIFEGVISDRGSKYSVSGGECSSSDEAKTFIKELCRKKKFAKATHNTWAFLQKAGPVKNDDGESGAGMVIVRMLQREELQNHIVVVTRWYGGKHLGGDRFRHVQNAVRYYLDNRNLENR
jgi:putative IMPACT (imprinted ancient) family translation regulator